MHVTRTCTCLEGPRGGSRHPFFTTLLKITGKRPESRLGRSSRTAIFNLSSQGAAFGRCAALPEGRPHAPSATASSPFSVSITPILIGPATPYSVPSATGQGSVFDSLLLGAPTTACFTSANRSTPVSSSSPETRATNRQKSHRRHKREVRRGSSRRVHHRTRTGFSHPRARLRATPAADAPPSATARLPSRSERRLYRTQHASEGAVTRQAAETEECT